MDNANLTNNVRVIQLSEGMADERDSLYQMQQDLNIPFELRECQCASLDE